MSVRLKRVAEIQDRRWREPGGDAAMRGGLMHLA